jgi:hypothetical protein
LALHEGVLEAREEKIENKETYGKTSRKSYETVVDRKMRDRHQRAKGKHGEKSYSPHLEAAFSKPGSLRMRKREGSQG